LCVLVRSVKPHAFSWRGNPTKSTFADSLKKGGAYFSFIIRSSGLARAHIWLLLCHCHCCFSTTGAISFGRHASRKTKQQRWVKQNQLLHTGEVLDNKMFELKNFVQIRFAQLNKIDPDNSIVETKLVIYTHQLN
jgi:hypothetical protein